MSRLSNYNQLCKQGKCVYDPAMQSLRMKSVKQSMQNTICYAVNAAVNRCAICETVISCASSAKVFKILLRKTYKGNEFRNPCKCNLLCNQVCYLCDCKQCASNVHDLKILLRIPYKRSEFKAINTNSIYFVINANAISWAVDDTAISYLIHAAVMGSASNANVYKILLLLL